MLIYLQRKYNFRENIIKISIALTYASDLVEDSSDNSNEFVSFVLRECDPEVDLKNRRKFEIESQLFIKQLTTKIQLTLQNRQ